LKVEIQFDKEEAVPVMAAAEELGTTRLRILTLIKEGSLIGGQEEGEWFVTRDSIDCFRKHGGDIRVQGKCRTSCGGSCGGH
jgi:hypothetical protein